MLRFKSGKREGLRCASKDEWSGGATLRGGQKRWHGESEVSHRLRRWRQPLRRRGPQSSDARRKARPCTRPHPPPLRRRSLERSFPLQPLRRRLRHARRPQRSLRASRQRRYTFPFNSLLFHFEHWNLISFQFIRDSSRTDPGNNCEEGKQERRFRSRLLGRQGEF